MPPPRRWCTPPGTARPRSEISAAVRAEGLSYSRFINGLLKAQVTINRLALSNLAIEDPAAFSALVVKAKAAVKA